MKKQTWKDPIILGAIAGSGMFKVRHPQWNANYKFSLMGEFIHECIGNLGVSFDDCTLIARHISSITEEEEEALESIPKDESSCRTDSGVTYYIESPESFLYLLSIGILPPNLSEEGVEFVNQQENNQ